MRSRGANPLGGFQKTQLLTQEDLVGRGPFAGVPAPLKDMSSLYNTTMALKEVVEVLTRLRGNEGDSSVRVSELNRVVDGLRFDIGELQDFATIAVKINREFALLRDQTSSFTSGQVIDSWGGGGVADVDSKIQANLGTGEITIAFTGLYLLKVDLVWAGTSNNVDFNIFIHINGGAGIRIGYAFQPSQAANATMVAVFYGQLLAGDVITFSLTGSSVTFELGQVSIRLETPSLQ